MASLIPFHGFSPAIKYLHIDCTCYPSSSIPDLIYSFPLLEDFSVIAFLGNRRQDNFDDKLAATQPSSSPAFTGTLGVFVWEGMHRIASALLSSPNGLHFRKLDLVLRSKQDVLATIALVDECSSTLESLKINYDIPDQSPDLIDLSKATKLGNVAVVCASNPQWVTMALRTIGPNHQSFQQLSVRAPGIFNNLGLASIKHNMGEADYLGWLELDHFLAQLHELRSIRPKVIFRGDGQKARSCAGLLLPEVTTGGIVDLENSQWQ